MFCYTQNKFSRQTGKPLWYGTRGTWQPMIFSYFASGSPLTFSWPSSFNLARSTCSFYWRYIIFLWSQISFYNYWLLVDIRKIKMENWKKLKRRIWQNNVNVQKYPLEVFYKKAVLKIFAIYIGKHLCWSFFLMKLFQHMYFPVNIAKFLRTSILKNTHDRLLLNVVFKSNKEQHLLCKLD